MFFLEGSVSDILRDLWSEALSKILSKVKQLVSFCQVFSVVTHLDNLLISSIRAALKEVLGYWFSSYSLYIDAEDKKFPEFTVDFSLAKPKWDAIPEP